MFASFLRRYSIIVLCYSDTQVALHLPNNGIMRRFDTGEIFCVCTHRKSLSNSLPRRRPASPRILIHHASPEDDRYPLVDPQLLRFRA